MTRTAARLVEEVVPDVPMRMLVLTLPKRLRYFLDKDRKIRDGVSRILAEETQRFFRKLTGLIAPQGSHFEWLEFGFLGDPALFTAPVPPSSRATFSTIRKRNRSSTGCLRPHVDGCAELVLTPMEFLQRIVTLIPLPRKNCLRYMGVFGANSALRGRVVRRSLQEQLTIFPSEEKKKIKRNRLYLTWAALIRRI